jgi:DNA-binding phage protein
MALIGTFAASSAAVFNLDFLPEKFLVQATSAETQGLSNFSVVCSGVQLMSITDADRLTALAKFDSGAILQDPVATPTATENQAAQYLRLATGRINKATTITGTNAIASVRNVYAASTNMSNVARRAVEQSINPSANATFDNFEALIFSPSNILRAQITFANGFSDEYTVPELDALFANYHISDAYGRLQGLVCIDADSGAGLISQVVLFNGSGGSTVVLKSDYVQL